MTLKVGDKVRHINRENKTGYVIQIEGGPEGDLTEVYWSDSGEALWSHTKHLNKEN
jgi:hypothetical protein